MAKSVTAGTNTSAQKHYVQSLPKYLTLCERNYANVVRLLPDPLAVGTKKHFTISQAAYQLEIKDTAKYTTDICISQTGDLPANLLSPPLYVRIYHDARVAEVIQPDFHARIKPAYGYPNPQMHQKDEKYQINAFLNDWLVCCLSNGTTPLPWGKNHVV